LHTIIFDVPTKSKMLICQQPHFNNQWMGQKNIDLLTVITAHGQISGQNSDNTISSLSWDPWRHFRPTVNCRLENVDVHILTINGWDKRILICLQSNNYVMFLYLDPCLTKSIMIAYLNETNRRNFPLSPNYRSEK
jgi:hypothetical protein